MAEEEESTGGSLKSIFIGLASTIALGVGGYVTKQLTGEEEAAQPAAVSAPAPVININQAAAQPAVIQGGTKTVIVKEKEAAPAKPKAKTEKEALEEEPKW
jgi:hypothetical protein